MDNRKFYEDKVNSHTQIIEQLKSTSGTISILRLIVFVAGLALVCLGASDENIGLVLTGIVVFVVFILLVGKHSKVEEELKTNLAIKEICEMYDARFGEGWRTFLDNGEEYLTDEDTVERDLDLLGKNSLFQLINIAHTKEGKAKLASVIKNSSRADFDAEDISSRQVSIQSLMQKKDFLVSYEAAGKKIAINSNKKQYNLESLFAFCEKQIKLPKWMMAGAWICSFGEIYLIIAALIGAMPAYFPLIGFTLMYIINAVLSRETAPIVAPFYGMSLVLSDYIKMADAVAEEEFEDEKLSNIKNGVVGEKGLFGALKGLNFVSGLCNISFNPLVHFILIGTLLWDVKVASSAIKWKNKFGNNIRTNFEGLFEIEMLGSLAVLGIVRETTFASITKEKDCYIATQGVSHPLISPDVAVSNSATIDNDITIITGSNMSGKTTFLRSLALNLCLAYIGAPVCATSLEASEMKIFTSMRVNDDVAGGISTFYAEILRIKNMSEFKKNNPGVKMICLVDEIFKGTNSADRIFGAGEVIKKLADNDCMVMVSTHDFELCTIEDKDGKTAVNYHFEEYYEDGKLLFDYHIKDGRCVTTNAREILKMAGF